MSDREAAKKLAREIHLLEMYLRSMRGHDTGNSLGPIAILFLAFWFAVGCAATSLAITLGFHT